MAGGHSLKARVGAVLGAVAGPSPKPDGLPAGFLCVSQFRGRWPHPQTTLLDWR
jgi:hypothetical protein